MEQWLRCKIVKGMFSDELGVTLRGKGTANETSVFVPKDQVNGMIDQPGKVKVTVFRQGDTMLAVLPSAEKTVVAVEDADLVSA